MKNDVAQVRCLHMSFVDTQETLAFMSWDMPPFYSTLHLNKDGTMSIACL